MRWCVLAALCCCACQQLFGLHDLSPDATFFDGPPADSNLGQACYGTGGALVTPCFASPPIGELMLLGPIDTDSDARCRQLAGMPEACVLAADMIVVASTGATATGVRSLVLVGATSITVMGTLDVASHVGGATGAAADPSSCSAGAAPQLNSGGAGGSFGTIGGAGGVGSSAGAGGTAGAATTASSLRGGCPGQTGAGSSSNGGTGGAGGGVAYLVSGMSITIAANGAIDASGAGGGGGKVSSVAGGGGGGAGGFIALDAPTVANDGVVYANGGGGGEGAAGAPGNDGGDPSGVTSAQGGAGGSSGGAGGTGGSGGFGAGAGGANAAPNSGGGGGGGGVGIIKVYTPVIAGSGAYSPMPS